MTQNEIRAAIILRVTNSGILDEQYISIGNDDTFNIPSTDVALWARLSTRFNNRTQRTLGGVGVCTKHTRVGIATLQVFTPITRGEYASDEAARQFEALFTKQTGDRPLHYGGSSSGGEVRTETAERDGPWYQQNIIIPFWSDEVVA